MPIALPQSLRTLLNDKAYGHVVTFTAKDQPRVTMVWMDVDGDEVLFNTAEGRNKIKDLRRDPRVIVSVQDRNNPQAYAVFHGKARITEEGARAHIDKLAKRFLGVDEYPGPPTEARLIVRISVDRVSGIGPGYRSWV
jgi:PPOX class probable F420-dependent enzyme